MDVIKIGEAISPEVLGEQHPDTVERKLVQLTNGTLAVNGVKVEMGQRILAQGYAIPEVKAFFVEGPLQREDLEPLALTIEDTLQPAPAWKLMEWVTTVRDTTRPMAKDVTDQEYQAAELVKALIDYPADIAHHALAIWPKANTFFPTISELRSKSLVWRAGQRKARLDALRRLQETLDADVST